MSRIEMNADIIVVAAGLSGLSASIAAAEKGLEVLTFEKSTGTGGAANMGMSPLAVGSKQQRMAGINISADDIFLKHMHYVHWKADARLVYDYYRKTASTIEWMENMGIEFILSPMSQYTPERMKPYALPENVGHFPKPANGNRIGPRLASVMVKGMTEYAKELPIQFMFETPVKSLIKEDGEIVGVRAVDRDGNEIEAYADAVIVATGGFGDNPKMIQEELGFKWGENLFSFRIPGNVGDGIKMCWDAGAGRTKTMMELMYQIPDNMNHFNLEGAFRQPNLWVNKLGERFMPEDCIANTATTGNSILEQPGYTCFSIMDDTIIEYYKENGVDFPGIHGMDIFDHWDEEVEKAKAEEYPYFYEADSIEELAKKTGIDPKGLAQTVEKYNEDCERGRDTIFNKPYQFMRKLSGKKFYALQSFPGAYGTLGGVKVNYRLEVCNQAGYPIPGLYCVGTDACNIFGDTYPFVIPGNTMGFCINSGRMAGEYAAEYVKSFW